MDDREFLADRFETHRTHRKSVVSDDEVTIAGGQIVAIDILADPDRLRNLDLAVLDSDYPGSDS